MEQALKQLSLKSGFCSSTSTPHSKAGEAMWERSSKVEPADAPNYGKYTDCKWSIIHLHIQGQWSRNNQHQEKPCTLHKDNFNQLAKLDYQIEDTVHCVEEACNNR